MKHLKNDFNMIALLGFIVGALSASFVLLNILGWWKWLKPCISDMYWESYIRKQINYEIELQIYAKKCRFTYMKIKESKYCPKCDTHKSWDDFYSDKYSYDGKRSCCKECANPPKKHKRCKECKELFPLTNFFKHTTSKDGLTYKCKTCSNKGRPTTRKGRAVLRIVNKYKFSDFSL